MIRHFTTKPELVHAVEFTGDNIEEVKEFVGIDLYKVIDEAVFIKSADTSCIEQLNVGDYVIEFDDAKHKVVTKEEMEANYNEEIVINTNGLF